MTELVLTRDARHGDWKTEMVNPRPVLKAGTVVQKVKEWGNFYGLWVQVKSADGTIYDLEPDAVRENPAPSASDEKIEEV